MLRFTARRLGGANAFMMLMRQCNGRYPTFVGLSGPTRAQKLSKVYSRLTPKRFELLQARARRVGSLYPRKSKRTPNQTAKFVAKNFEKVDGTPEQRFRSLAKQWILAKKATA